jgi:hypothetical protein
MARLDVPSDPPLRVTAETRAPGWCGDTTAVIHSAESFQSLGIGSSAPARVSIIFLLDGHGLIVVCQYC